MSIAESIAAGLAASETHAVSGALLDHASATNVAQEVGYHCYYSGGDDRYYFSRQPRSIGPALHEAGYRWLA